MVEKVMDPIWNQIILGNVCIWRRVAQDREDEAITTFPLALELVIERDKCARILERVVMSEKAWIRSLIYLLAWVHYG